MLAACSSSTMTVPAQVPTDTPAAASSASASAASGWYPQAVPDSAMPDPNVPATSFSSAQAIAAKLNWQSNFGVGQQGIVNGSPVSVNAQGQEISSPEPGETIEVVNEDNGQQIEQEEIWAFSSPAQEQAFAAGGAQASSDGNPEYALLGPGWAIGVDDASAQNLEYAQGIIGGSLVTWFEGQVEGFL
jgi:hypothetical protein